MKARVRRRAVGLAIVILSSAACGEDDPGPADAGGSMDAARPSDAGGAPDADVPRDLGAADAAGVEVGGADAGEGLASGGAWTLLAPMPGGARQETSVVALGGEIYVLGGFDGSAQVVDRVEAYDPSTNQWRARAPLPFPLHHINAAAVDGKIYVVGALTGLGFVQSPNVLVYDPGPDRWESLGEMPAGTDRGASGVAVLGRTIYLAGGYRAGQALTLCSAYDTASGAFEALPALPSPLDHLVSVALDGRVYVIGGRNRSIQSTRAEVWSFEPADGAWRARAPLPRARAGFAGAAALGGRIYVFGGEGNPDPGSRGVFADGDAYDPAADRWAAVSPMRTPRHGTSAAALGDRIFVPGGATQQAFGAVDVHEAFQP